MLSWQFPSPPHINSSFFFPCHLAIAWSIPALPVREIHTNPWMNWKETRIWWSLRCRHRWYTSVKIRDDRCVGESHPMRIPWAPGPRPSRPVYRERRSRRLGCPVGTWTKVNELQWIAVCANLLIKTWRFPYLIIISLLGGGGGVRHTSWTLWISNRPLRENRICILETE